MTKHVNVKEFGVRFLEPHTRKKQQLNLDDQHSIVDKDDLFRIIDFFRLNQDVVDHFNNFNSGYHIKLLHDNIGTINKQKG